jgi:HD superfamily phosphohydrolase YqeK
VLFIADYISSDRVGDTHDIVRGKIAEGKIYEAMLEECDATLIYNIKRDILQLCTQTVRTRNWIVSKIKEKK